MEVPMTIQSPSADQNIAQVMMIWDNEGAFEIVLIFHSTYKNLWPSMREIKSNLIVSLKAHEKLS